MTLNEIKAYLASYATRHKLLLHNPADKNKATFFCLGSDKTIVQEFIRNNKMDRIMVLLIPDKMLNKANDNYAWYRNLAILILQRCPDVTADAIADASNTCEEIGNDFMTRFISDRTILIDSIRDNGVDMQPAGPLGDKHYGVMLMFTQVDLFDYAVDDSRWNA